MMAIAIRGVSPSGKRQLHDGRASTVIPRAAGNAQTRGPCLVLVGQLTSTFRVILHGLTRDASADRRADATSSDMKV